MSRVRALTIVWIVTVAALVIAGCGDDGDDGGGSGAALPGLAVDNCADVEYGGDGDATGLIVSDLPMQGDSAERSQQQVDAIRLVLEDHGWRAGDTAVAFQACDDSIAKTGLWDEDTCRADAQAYSDAEDVLGVIGTYNSGCAAIEIPILNRAGVAMISPGNTAVCLTESSSICQDYDPDSLYPSGQRNYARVVPNDAFQGAALAEFADSLGVERPFVLYAADDPTSTGQAVNFRGGALALGLDLAGFKTWDPKADDYGNLVGQVEQSGADGVVLAGLIEQNGAQLIRDKVAALGSNDAVPLIAFDGFAQQSTIDGAGQAARGMYASAPGSTPDALTGDGAALVADLEASLDGRPVEQFAPYAGEAAAVLLDAIATAGTDRAAVIAAVFATKGGGGILEPYDITATGDPSLGPITVLRATSTFEPDQEVVPTATTVRAARG